MFPLTWTLTAKTPLNHLLSSSAATSDSPLRQDKGKKSVAASSLKSVKDSTAEENEAREEAEWEYNIKFRPRKLVKFHQKLDDNKFASSRTALAKKAAKAAAKAEINSNSS